jgi:hypothetical protein
MRCRSCGTEIADKAIVCYRCGQATTDPVRKPAALTPARSPLFAVVAAAILAAVALYVGYASQTAADPARWQTIAGVLGGAALMVLVLGILRRRR